MRAALIPAGELPGFNDTFRWDRQRIRRGPGPHPPPACSRSSLLSIGGVAAARSDYRSSSDDSTYAVQVTAVFPDKQTAARSESVLIAWHDRCQQLLGQQGRTSARVSSIADVATDVGIGKQWLSTYRPVPGDREASYFHAEGFVRAGDRISYLVILSAGQDYNYEPGEEPMAKALEKAGDYLRDN
ncbi:MAG: hypothetical protein H0U61_01595 [Nocardioidaceae bacterium]|nr:hypothetical protein [Nocardioidaceae bacterium]